MARDAEGSSGRAEQCRSVGTALTAVLHRVHAAAVRMGFAQLTTVIVAAAMILSLSLSVLIWSALYGSIEERTLRVAAVVTLLTATPLSVFMVHLIKRTDRSRKELEETNAALEHERAKQAASVDALRRARDEAHAANRAKTLFLANVSHELRTPLNAILGFSEMMDNEAFGPVGDERYRDYVRDIRGSGEHLLKVINDILDVARIEAGSIVLDEDWCDLAELADATIRLTQPHATTARLALRNHLPESCPRIWGDSRTIKQMLLNLLSNAVKFTPAGGEVAVGGGPLPDGGYELFVRDTGIGIEAGDHERALAPFSQVDNSLTREHQGTGLGLSLTRSLIELHGGTLALESAAGEGTTVRLRFPSVRVDASSRSAAGG